MTTHIRRLSDVVAHASLTVPFYEWFYGGVRRIESWGEFHLLPLVDEAVLHAETYGHTLSTTETICLTRVFEAGYEGGRTTPAFRSYQDVLDEYDVLKHMLRTARIRRRQRVVLVASLDRLYSAGEFARYLAFYQGPMLAAIDNGVSATTLKVIAKFRPSLAVIDSSGQGSFRLLPSSVGTVIVFSDGNTNRLTSQSKRTVVVLRHHRLGALAVSSGEDLYVYDRTKYYFEIVAGELVVTSLCNRLQPMIRVRLGIRATLAGAGSFAITPQP